METMAKINKNYIDGIVEWINFNSIFGITVSQLDIARLYKIDIDDILNYCIHAERILYKYNHYDIVYKTSAGYTYNIIIVIE